MNGELGSSRNNSGTCASPCNGEVEVDYSQLETAEDYQAVAGHLDSLAGDSDVNQASLGIAQFNTGVAATRANFAEFTQVDIANGVFEYRFKQSQVQALTVVGTAAAAPIAGAYTIRGVAYGARGVYRGGAALLRNKAVREFAVEMGGNLLGEMLDMPSGTGLPKYDPNIPRLPPAIVRRIR